MSRRGGAWTDGLTGEQRVEAWQRYEEYCRLLHRERFGELGPEYDARSCGEPTPCNRCDARFRLCPVWVRGTSRGLCPWCVVETDLDTRLRRHLADKAQGSVADMRRAVQRVLPGFGPIPKDPSR